MCIKINFKKAHFENLVVKKNQKKSGLGNGKYRNQIAYLIVKKYREFFIFYRVLKN